MQRPLKYPISQESSIQDAIHLMVRNILYLLYIQQRNKKTLGHFCVIHSLIHNTHDPFWFSQLSTYLKYLMKSTSHSRNTSGRRLRNQYGSRLICLRLRFLPKALVIFIVPLKVIFIENHKFSGYKMCLGLWQTTEKLLESLSRRLFMCQQL